MANMNYEKLNRRDKIRRYPEKVPEKKPYLPKSNEQAFIDWLAIGCQKHGRPYPDWREIVPAIRGRNLDQMRVAFKVAVSKQSIPDASVIAYAIGVYRNLMKP